MLLMDLGGWTVDLMRIDNAIPAADTAHSLELGMIRCVDDIREQVRRETGLSLTDAQIENMLAGQPCTVSDKVKDIVNQQGRRYTEHLLSATMEAGFDLHAIPAVLLGGGASVVSRHLTPKDGLCKTIFLLDDKVNAVGFERALAAVSRRKRRGMKRPQYVFPPEPQRPATPPRMGVAAADAVSQSAKSFWYKPFLRRSRQIGWRKASVRWCGRNCRQST